MLNKAGVSLARQRKDVFSCTLFIFLYTHRTYDMCLVPSNTPYLVLASHSNHHIN